MWLVAESGAKQVRGEIAVDAIYLSWSKEFDEVSHEVSHIKLVQIVWKKNIVKLRIGKGLRGKNKELQPEMCEFTNT